MPEHHVGDRVARLRAEEPRDEHRVGVAHRAFQRQRAPVAQQHDDGLADGGDRFGQRLLRGRNGDLHARLRFAAVVLRFAQREHDDVGARGGFDSRFDAAVERRFRRAAGDDVEQ